MKWGLIILFFWRSAMALAQSPADGPVRFQAVDIYVNSGAAPLAAYQIEFKATNGNLKIVGVEGGEPAVFKNAPYYDPKAMQQERVVIAAFSTEAEVKLPKGKTRVATIHLQITGNQIPQYQVKLQAAADGAGRKISVEATVEERKPQ
jgi:hypothetical protein